MARWRVEYQGSIEVDADSEAEAECNAAFDCKPENCRATELVSEEDDEDSQ